VYLSMNLRGRAAAVGMVLLCVLAMAGCGGSTSTSGNITATPSFSPGGGTYNTTQSVTIADTTPGAVLYCTTDGTQPTTSSPQCSQPTIVAKSMYLQAIGVASGKSASAVASAGFTIDLNAAATPTFSPGGGTYSSAQTVTIASATSGARIYYTTDGSTPTTSATLYTGTITVSQGETLNAIAVANGYNNSGMASAVYAINIPAANPIFSLAGGTYTTVQSLTITDSTPGATIYYTLDGTTPSATNGAVYSGPIPITNSETVSAVAVAPGYVSSAVVSAAYVIAITADTPTFSVSSGTYSSAQSVTIGDTTSGATIYYTTDGTAPTTSSSQYSGTPISISQNTILKAMAKTANGTASPVAVATYVISAATPTFSPSPSGSYTYDPATPVAVAIADTTPGATIYYTTDGTTPSTSSSKYTGTLSVTKNTTINAVAVASNYGTSATGTASYTIAAATPAITASGTPTSGVYNSVQTVTITDTTPNKQIYYTTDGSVPSATNGTLYSAPFNVVSSQTITAIAIASNYSNSAIASMAFKIQLSNTSDPVLTIVGGSTTTGGTLNAPAQITISDAISGATVYYTLDGTTPSKTNGTKYTSGANISISPQSGSTSVTLKAIATSSLYADSQVVSATFTFSVAAPTFALADGTLTTGGSFSTTQQVTLSDATPGSTIYYISGANPTTPVTAWTPYVAGTKIAISATETLNAAAVATGYSDSTVASATFTILHPAPAPTISPNGGGFVGSRTVTISDSATNPVIYYTTDGSTPSADKQIGTLYTGTITVSGSETITAVATASGYGDSSPTSATFSLLTGQIVSGTVSSGTKGIAGATVYVYAAGANGYGTGASPVTTTPGTVTTDASGNFVLSYGAACPASPGDQLFLVAKGGTVVGGADNAANDSIALMTALGTCGNLQTTQTAVINEATTIASVYALQQFMGADSTVEGGLSVGASSFNSKGMMSAFNTVGNLVDVTSGNVWGATVNGSPWGLPSTITWHAAGVGVTPGYANGTTVTVNGTPKTYAPQQFFNDSTVPASRINTLANILAACVDAAANCSTLWDATKTGSLTPANTLEAALNIATNPGGVKLAGGNLNNLWTLSTTLGAAAPYTPALGAQPNDFTLVLTFTSAGLGETPGDVSNGYGVIPKELAIDADGSILTVGWSATDVAGDGSNNMIVKFNNLGLPQTPATVKVGTYGFTYGGVNTYAVSPGAGLNPGALAIDASGNPWIYTAKSGSVHKALSELTPAFTASSTMDQDIFGYIQSTAHPLAFDSAGNLWGGRATRYWEFTPGTGYLSDSWNWVVLSGGRVGGLTFDPSGNLWAVDGFVGNIYQLATNNPATGPWALQTFPVTIDVNHDSLAADGSGNTYGCSATTAISVFSASGQATPATQTGRCGQALAVDGGGHLWSVSVNDSTYTTPGVLDELILSGSDFNVLSPTAGYTGTGTGEASTILTDYDPIGTGSTRALSGMAIDGSGNLWVMNHNTGQQTFYGPTPTGALQGNMLVEYVGLAAPVTTPKAVETANTKQGKRP